MVGNSPFEECVRDFSIILSCFSRCVGYISEGFDDVVDILVPGEVVVENPPLVSVDR